MESESETFDFDRFEFQHQLKVSIADAKKRFNKQLKVGAVFHLSFMALIVVEILLFFIFLGFLIQSSVLAFSLAFLFLTVFSFLSLRLYLQSKRPEQFIGEREAYCSSVSLMMRYQEGIAEHHLALASALERLAKELESLEYGFYQPPMWLHSLVPVMEKFSCWWHWRDLHDMRELLLFRAIEEHLKLVKCEPTNLEVHAGLANAYVLLSGLYADPRKNEGYDEERWIPPERYSEEMQKRFRETAQCAIEEFKILNDYAPDDAWVHTQLAYSYHDLQMPAEEIREYETILSLRPGDADTLFKLGMLYFEQGKNAQGLRIYEELKRSYYEQAESLIKFYGG